MAQAGHRHRRGPSLRPRCDDGAMTERRLVHGYTNQSWRDGGLVIKQYQNGGAAQRVQTETAPVARGAGVVPVPGGVEGGTGRGPGPVAVLSGGAGGGRVGQGRGAGGAEG